jgi:predicted AAA+ superfamily ATPase
MFPIAFAVVTGSSAHLLQSTADLVTRRFIRHVYPLNFGEYINFTHSNILGIKDSRLNMQEFLFSADNATTLFDKIKNIQRI